MEKRRKFFPYARECSYEKAGHGVRKLLPFDRRKLRLFRNPTLQQQRDSFGYSPAVLAQQSFPQQTKMLVSLRVRSFIEADPDFFLPDFHGKCLKVVALIVEASAAFKIETPAVPVAGENPVPDRSACQRIAHVRTLIVGCVDAALDIEKCDAMPVLQPDRFCFARRYIFQG